MSKFFETIARPLLFALDAEAAHEIGLKALKLGIGWRRHTDENARLREIFGPIVRFGLKFGNPLGIAAGFDKNGVVINQLAELGFGFVEVGTVTFEPQKGNPKPRLFRLPNDQALINRLGFNNDGAIKIAERLSRLEAPCIVGANIGRNKDVPNANAVENYLRTFERVHSVADYVAINVSSPNTPDLRDLQSAENLERILEAVQHRNRELGLKPLLVKIAPDLDDVALQSVIETCMVFNVSGIIATNTMVSRQGLVTVDVRRFGPGGLSGRPLAQLSNLVISKIYRYSNGKMPIIGVGGIFSACDAFEKIVSGACLLEAYTGFIYKGPSFPYDINRGLARILKEKGFSTLDEAVGSAASV